MKIFAKFDSPSSGWDYDVEYSSKRLIAGNTYELKTAEVGRSSSCVYLKDIEGSFNSVQFSFYDEDDNEVNIYKMPEFSTYIY